MLPIITVVHGNGESGLWMTDTSERNYEKRMRETAGNKN